jgi:hypothetical protein
MKRWIRFWSISDECGYLYGTSEDIEDSAEELGFDELDGWEYASPKEISKLEGLEDEGVVQL